MTCVVLSGGGTAGHINPALALAEILQQRGCTVYFAGTPNGVESRLVPQAGLDFKGFNASGFRRSHPVSLVSGVAKILKSTRQAKRWFAEIKPDVVVGFGGYVSIPVSRAAEELHIPVVLHEQNSVMGMANKFLSKRAQALCVTYEHSVKEVGDKSKVHLTGNPVRSSVLKATREEGRAFLGIPDTVEMLLVFGGSGGARHINDAVVSMKDELLAKPDLYVMHITGPKEFDRVAQALDLTDDEASRYLLLGYQDHMAEALAATDAIVSRAGATSLAEISARGIPALLIPFPYAAEDHQTINAQEYVDSGAAFLIPDAEIDSPEFKEKVMQLIDDEQVRAQMSRAARRFGSADAARKLADVVLAQVNR